MSEPIDITGEELNALGIEIGTPRFRVLAAIVQRNVAAERARTSSLREIAEDIEDGVGQGRLDKHFCELILRKLRAMLAAAPPSPPLQRSSR